MIYLNLAQHVESPFKMFTCCCQILLANYGHVSQTVVSLLLTSIFAGFEALRSLAWKSFREQEPFFIFSGAIWEPRHMRALLGTKTFCPYMPVLPYWLVLHFVLIHHLQFPLGSYTSPQALFLLNVGRVAECYLCMRPSCDSVVWSVLEDLWHICEYFQPTNTPWLHLLIWSCGVGAAEFHNATVRLKALLSLSLSCNVHTSNTPFAPAVALIGRPWAFRRWIAKALFAARSLLLLRLSSMKRSSTGWGNFFWCPLDEQRFQ